MNQVFASLYATLTASTAVTSLLAKTTAVYDTQAPQSATYPMLIMQQQAWAIETTDANEREDAYITIKAIATGSFGQAGTIDAAVRTLLNNGSASISGHTTLWQKATEQIRYVETDSAGRNFYHVGHVYRLRFTNT
jgi:hypothetical protein